MSHLVLSNKDLSIKINPLGAELQSFHSNKLDLELLWQADVDYWPRHAPILFPIVGKLANNQLIEGNKAYPLTQHGFARDMEFEPIFQSSKFVQLRLQSSEATLEKYPYPFELLVEYLLKDNTLRTTFVIRNNSETSLPFSVGGHPAFNWPLIPGIDKESHYILFEENETVPLLQLEEGLVSTKRLPTPIINKKIALKDELFKNDALIFDSLNSNKITYIAGEQCRLEMQFDDFPQLGIWTKQGADFICLEPWIGYASPQSYEGEFRKKPGIRTLPGYAETAVSFDILLKLS